MLIELASNWLVCQIKSWSRFPSFLDKSSFLACVTTSTTSATSSRPSAERFLEGLDRALLETKLFRATSIWSFYERKIISFNPTFLRLWHAIEDEDDRDEMKHNKLTEGTLPS